MNKKKVIIISIIAIVLLIGGTFAYWMLNLSQTTTNNMATSCFSISLSEDNAINLQNAFPMRDSEGGSLTPYEFTITNNCSTYAYYEVNLEVLNTTNLNSEYIKLMLDDEEPSLLSNKTETTTTLSSASSSYRLKTAYLHASESKTYNLRLWLDGNVTLADNVTEKQFSGKITIRATYKPDVPTQMEECELQYGEGAGVCNFIAQADLANNKCLHTDSNGMITDYNATMSDSDTPIVCAMEDDYGTSYYLRGLHTDNNVKFANSCWKIIRTTGTGGIKMIYNGDVDGSGACSTTSGEHIGFSGQELTLSGDIVYGDSYTKGGSTYTLNNTDTMNWSIDSTNIMGKYTCGNTDSSCANPYYVVSRKNDTTGYVLKMGVSTNYAQIGTSAYNSSYNSPSYVGYMYNDVYSNHLITMTTSTTLLSSQTSSTSNFYYGDTLSYSGGYYYITNQDGSNVAQLSWAENYENNLVGKYTCRSTSKYNDTTLRCSTAYKVLDTTTQTNYIIAEYLSGGRLAVGTIKLSSDYTDNGDGTYTLNSPITEKSAMEWYNGYSSFNNYYVCEDYNQTTCNKLYKITSASNTSIGGKIGIFNNYYYGSSFMYTDGAERPYTLTNTEQVWDISDSTNKTKLNTHHYTCFNATDATCTEMYYIYYLSGIAPYYIKLNGNETITDALNKMVSNNDINVKDSTIKKGIDGWYAMNIKGTEYESKLEDTVFCNDRTIDDLGSWSESGSVSSSSTSYLKFNAFNNKYYLKCPNKRDAFTVSDSNKGNSALTYPTGLLTIAEHSLTGNATANKTGTTYWASAPTDFRNANPRGWDVGSSGTWLYNFVSGSCGVRPSISLKPGTKFIAGGDGTASNPYEVDMNG